MEPLPQKDIWLCTPLSPAGPPGRLPFGLELHGQRPVRWEDDQKSKLRGKTRVRCLHKESIPKILSQQGKAMQAPGQEVRACERRELSGRPRLPPGGHRRALHMPRRAGPGSQEPHAALPGDQAPRGPGSGWLAPSLLLPRDCAAPGPTSPLARGGGLGTSWFADSAPPLGLPGSLAARPLRPASRRQGQGTRLGGSAAADVGGKGAENTFLKYPPDTKDSACDQDIPGRHPQTAAVLQTRPQKADGQRPPRRQPAHPSSQIDSQAAPSPLVTFGGGHLPEGCSPQRVRQKPQAGAGRARH